MRGSILFVFGITGLFLFSGLMCSSSSLSFFWLFLELCSLCVIPLFFITDGDAFIFSGLFNYIVVSSISSSLILCGLLEEVLIFLMICGLLLKFGLFPFWGWIYSVGLSSNWFVIWAISTLLKIPIFFFPLLLKGGGFFLVSVLASVSLLLLSFLFWVYTYSWYYCWCHMMLASSACLVAMSFFVPLEVLFFIFVVYFLWSSLVIIFFYYFGDGSLGGVSYYYFFVFLLITTPISFSIFYKIIFCVGVFSCSFVVMVCWVIYSVSEQIYLLKYIISCGLPKSGVGLFSVI
uniref:NADH dehydrogenase subunit 2 n=1 Tax=Morishitium polonicum TaxID=1962582 RepID=UPI0023AA5F6A|nr:NADH dehydrogenase subunit 2 [Morishitium polonicum]WCD42522.1 NADH dehydrogenase subunit 2 [Morishitium polonicum]